MKKWSIKYYNAMPKVVEESYGCVIMYHFDTYQQCLDFLASEGITEFEEPLLIL